MYIYTNDTYIESGWWGYQYLLYWSVTWLISCDMNIYIYICMQSKLLAWACIANIKELRNMNSGDQKYLYMQITLRLWTSQDDLTDTDTNDTDTNDTYIQMMHERYEENLFANEIIHSASKIVWTRILSYFWLSCRSCIK